VKRITNFVPSELLTAAETLLDRHLESEYRAEMDSACEAMRASRRAWEDGAELPVTPEALRETCVRLARVADALGEHPVSGKSPVSFPGMEFSCELRSDVLPGDITLSVRLWKRPRVKQGGRYRVGPGEIEVDAIELIPFATITRRDVREPASPTARRCASAPRTPGRSTRTRWLIESSSTR
jgi:hypothetical protein